MNDVTTPAQPLPSPLDPFLVQFLTQVREIATGYGLSANGKSIAERIGVDPAFVEALTVSARRRRLIEAFYAPAHRNALRWRVSARGEAFLASHGVPLSTDHA